ncbi:MAG: isopentenyl phosphate kinase [Anaerolineae bacterium]|nr:isopentenyl phosphate kinase [Anaerolineae bacterium]
MLGSNSINPLLFLKLGGSLITEKTQTSAARPETIARIAGEIKAALQARPGLRLVLGHGSGSFGHVPAKKHGTRQGVSSQEEWTGFYEVWHQASALNRIVIEEFHRAGIRAISLPPSAAVTAADGKVLRWDLAPLQSALARGLLPVVFGDVVFDTLRGGTILSTEDLFFHLAGQLHPARILLAGIEPGVWADYPQRTQLAKLVTPSSFADLSGALSGSAATDVTGGMAAKVKEMLALVGQSDGLDALIFSGEEPGSIRQALLGEDLGTRILGHG